MLDGKRSLNINIFLRQFRTSNEDIIQVQHVRRLPGRLLEFLIFQMVLDGEFDDFGAEKLKGLVKILPEMDEIEMLRSFDGDKTKLGNAERFVLQLVDVPK